MVNALYMAQWEVYVCSGRPERVRQQTKDWLFKNRVLHGALLLRKDTDRRHSWELKAQFVKGIQDSCAKESIPVHIIAFEDRDADVKAMRNLGVRVYQTQVGEY